MTGPLRVEAVLSGRWPASSRFRVLQHVPALRALGVEVRARPPRVSKYAAVPGHLARGRLAAPLARAALDGAKLAARLPVTARTWRADVTWLEREVLPGHLSLEPALHRPVLFDVDDAVWLLSPGHERATRAIARRAACVLAGNDFLAEWFAPLAPAVERVWTAIDTERFVPRASPAPGADGPFVVGWTGSGMNLRFVESTVPALKRFMAEAPDARLLVMADSFVPLSDLPAERVELVPWTPGTEVAVIQRFDVGLMPLGQGLWSKGKCAFKMLQYMACAVPSVVTPAGMNAQVLALGELGVAASSEDEWVEALLSLYRDRDRARALGRGGRAVAERSFSIPVIAPQLASAMQRYR